MLKDNISFFVVDLAQLLQSRPGHMAELWAELGRKFDDGTYASLPLEDLPRF
jgi:hypothetical protein